MLPSVAGNARVVTALMQSALSDVEKQREAEEARLAQKRGLAAPVIQPDANAAKAKSKIISGLFGPDRIDADPLVKLVAHAARVMGIELKEGEPSYALAAKMTNAVQFIELVDRPAMILRNYKLTLESIDLDLKMVMEAQAKGGTDNGLAGVIARIAADGGVTRNALESDGDYLKRLEAFLTEKRKALPDTLLELEKMTGLWDLGVTIHNLIEATRNPYGEDAKRIRSALDDARIEPLADTITNEDGTESLEFQPDRKAIEEKRTLDDAPRLSNNEVDTERAKELSKREALSNLETIGDILDIVSDRIEPMGAGSTPIVSEALTVLTATATSLPNDAKGSATPESVVGIDENGVYDLRKNRASA